MTATDQNTSKAKPKRVKKNAAPATTISEASAVSPDEPKQWKIPSMDMVLATFDKITSIHPACEAVPEIDAESFNELVSAIEKDGLIDPIKIDSEGQLLDGRNRLAACFLLGADPRFEVPKAGAWAIATSNIARRHLSVGQRAAFANERLEHEKEAAAERQKETLKKGNKVPDCGNSHTRKGRATDLAGKAVGVSGSSVNAYGKLPKALKKKVKAGKKSLHAASQEAAGNKVKKKAKPKKPPIRKNQDLPEGIEIAYQQGKVIVLCHPESAKQAVIRGPVETSYLFHLDDAHKGLVYKSAKVALTSGAKKLLESANVAQPIEE